jgi:hypothetical protein
MQIKDFTTEQLKTELANRGFGTFNLFTDRDVDECLNSTTDFEDKPIYRELSFDEKMDVLKTALNNDYLVEQTFEAIKDALAEYKTD